MSLYSDDCVCVQGIEHFLWNFSTPTYGQEQLNFDIPEWEYGNIKAREKLEKESAAAKEDEDVTITSDNTLYLVAQATSLVNKGYNHLQAFQVNSYYAQLDSLDHKWLDADTVSLIFSHNKLDDSMIVPVPELGKPVLVPNSMLIPGTLSVAACILNSDGSISSTLTNSIDYNVYPTAIKPVDFGKIKDPQLYYYFLCYVQKLIKDVQDVASGHIPADYNALENQPSINGVVLQGDKSTKDLKIAESELGLPAYITKLGYYNYELKYDTLDYEFAKNNISGGFSVGACTSIYKNGMLGRNFDFYYNHQVEAIVTTKDTFAVCGGLSGLTGQAMEDGTASKRDLKLLPFYVRDGMNKYGLTCSIHVVPFIGMRKSNPLIETRHTFSAVCLLRYVLDNFNKAEEACKYIQDYVSIVVPDALISMGFEAHYIIADKEKAFYLEVINNKVVYREANALTNFRLEGVSFTESGKVYTPEDQSQGLPHRDQGIDLYGTGLERYNICKDRLQYIANVADMSYELKNLYYSKTYDRSVKWYTEFTFNASEDSLTVDSPLEKFLPVKEKMAQKWESEDTDTKRRDAGDLWYTSHSIVYEMYTGKIYLYFNEVDKLYEYKIIAESSGGGGGDVRSVNGKRGDVVLKAEDIKANDGSTLEDLAQKTSKVDEAVAKAEQYKTQAGNYAVEAGKSAQKIIEKFVVCDSIEQYIEYVHQGIIRSDSFAFIVEPKVV